MWSLKNTIALLTLSLIVISCGQDDKNGANKTTQTTTKAVNSGFSIVDSQVSGIDFSNILKDDPQSDKNVLSYQLYFNGAGVGVGDFNNDGLQDIFFAGNEVPNAL